MSLLERLRAHIFPTPFSPRVLSKQELATSGNLVCDYLNSLSSEDGFRELSSAHHDTLDRGFNEIFSYFIPVMKSLQQFEPDAEFHVIPLGVVARRLMYLSSVLLVHVSADRQDLRFFPVLLASSNEPPPDGRPASAAADFVYFEFVESELYKLYPAVKHIHPPRNTITLPANLDYQSKKARKEFGNIARRFFDMLPIDLVPKEILPHP